MLIRNYGLFWDREKPNWGWQKHAGTLKGVHSKDRRGGEVDFREQTGIYALYDAAFNLVYIGQTGSGDQKLLKRLNDHQVDHLSQRWKYFSWFGVCYVKNDNTLADQPENIQNDMDTLLDHLEAIAITIAEPKLNLQGGRWGSQCEQYYQVEG